MSTQYAMPPYFTWLVDNVLAVSAHPFHHTHLNYLKLNKIETVVSFDDQNQTPFHTNPFMKVVRFSNNSLSLNDCINFVYLVENAKLRREGVLVHCVKGEERAAVLSICFLVKLWQCRPDFAINYYRTIRPSSLEKREFEELVFEFYNRVSSSFVNLTHKDLKWTRDTEFLGKNLDMFVNQPIPDSYQQRIQH
ncbi:unnamed protein product [Brachionus calyciflorus]|uniref:Tyrosine specific protein phosphatases domain-containing protein n=1 Tax=Brachionus calyciflorus TaxID=104777 RepID=A0A813TM36_9BILA|nr:unnamed protein product [Brachionus calyciflorus]